GAAGTGHDCPRTFRDVPSPSKDLLRQIPTVQGRAATSHDRPRTCHDRPSPSRDLPRPNLTAQAPATTGPRTPRTCRNRTSPTELMLQQQTKPDLLRIVSGHRQPHQYMRVQKSQKKEMAQLGQLSFRMADC
ncbi:unnamed protein product, partial [Ixodes persulcatus]